MNGLARLSTGTSPVRSSPSYSQSRPVSLLLHRPIEFTRSRCTRLASAARYLLPYPDDAFRFEVGAWESPGGDDPASEAHAQGLPEVGLEPLGRVLAGDLHQQRHLVHLAYAPMLDHELGDLGMAADDVLDLGRVEIHAAHGEHVVDPSTNAPHELEEWAAAGARLARDPDPVAGPIAHQWHAPAAKVRGDQLAFNGGPPSAVEHFEDELGLDRVDAIPLRAAEAGRAELGHAGVVEARRGVGRLDGCTSRGDARAWLPRVERDSNLGRLQLDAETACHAGQPQRVRRSGHEDCGAEVEHRADALLAGHRSARDGQSVLPLGSIERRPEADEGSEGEREEYAVAGADAGGRVDVLGPDPHPPVPRFGSVQPPQRMIAARP